MEVDGSAVGEGSDPVGGGTPGASRDGTDEHNSTVVTTEEPGENDRQLRLLSDAMRTLLADDHFR